MPLKDYNYNDIKTKYKYKSRSKNIYIIFAKTEKIVKGKLK